MESEAAAVETPEKPKDAVASISTHLALAGHGAVLSKGDHASLRRMYLTKKPAADGAVIKLLLNAGMKPHEYEKDYQAWRLLVHVAALLSGTGKVRPHDPRKPLGAALRALWPEKDDRFLRLTAIRGDALDVQVARVGRALAQKGHGPLNLPDVLNLASRYPDKAEKARIRIAQDYYSAAKA